MSKQYMLFQNNICYFNVKNRFDSNSKNNINKIIRKCNFKLKQLHLCH